MAHAESSKRIICLGCSSPLLEMDRGHQFCLLCRTARSQGRVAWGKRMAHVTKSNRAQGKIKPIADPFKGLRDEDDVAEWEMESRTAIKRED